MVFGSRIAQETNPVPRLLSVKQACAALGISRTSVYAAMATGLAAGISPKSFANIRSDLFAAIKASRLKPISPARQSLSEPWRGLMTELTQQRRRIGLSRLAGYASVNGLTPGDINDSVIADFIAAIHEGSLHRKPNELHRSTTVIIHEVPIIEVTMIELPTGKSAGPPWKVRPANHPYGHPCHRYDHRLCHPCGR
jgi:hypothetical protein